MFLFSKRNYKITASIGSISSGIHRLSVMQDKGARSHSLQKNHLIPFLKPQVMRVSKTARIHGANNKPLRIVGSKELYIHVGGLPELVNFLVCKRLDVPAKR